MILLKHFVHDTGNILNNVKYDCNRVYECPLPVLGHLETVCMGICQTVIHKTWKVNLLRMDHNPAENNQITSLISIPVK